jgi:hypothetical protein
MSGPVEELMLTARRCGVLPLLLRVAIAVGAGGAIIATAAPSWDVPDAYLVIAIIAGVTGVFAPDTGAAAFASGAVVVAWATGTSGGIGPATVVTALSLLVLHVASALASAMPITARGDTHLALRWARPTAVLAGATVATAALVAVLERWSPPGSIVLVLLTLALLGVGTWWLTTGSDR